MRLNRSRQQRIVRWGAIFVLLMVLLPGITYVGHWDALGSQPTHTHSGEHDPDDGQDHAAHCHEGPSTCTGPQATVGSWWIGDDPNPIVAAQPTLTPFADTDQTPIEAPATRLVPPPRFA